jgi:hypothetical protein
MAKKKPQKRTAKSRQLTVEGFTVKKALAQFDGPATSLGNTRAVTIACHCANTVLGNLPRTLAELGVGGLPFRRCVALSVRNAGFVASPASIPAAPDSTLIDVVNAIHNAPPAQ